MKEFLQSSDYICIALITICDHAGWPLGRKYNCVCARTVIAPWCNDIYELIGFLITETWMTAHSNKAQILIAARHVTCAKQAHTYTQRHKYTRTHTHAIGARWQGRTRSKKTTTSEVTARCSSPISRLLPISQMRHRFVSISRVCDTRIRPHTHAHTHTHARTHRRVQTNCSRWARRKRG